MSREENIALIRAGYDAWARGDFEDFLESAHPNIEWIPPPYAIEHEPFRGKEEIRRGIAAYFESFDLFPPEPKEILPGERDGEYVVLATTHTRGKGSGVEVATDVAHLITVRDGKVARFEVIPDRPEALERAGVRHPG